MSKAIAKRNVRFIKDSEFVEFTKGNTYRCLFRSDDIMIINDDGQVVFCDIDKFEENFELLN